MTPRLVSQRSPFIPIDGLFADKRAHYEALLDTGFDGDVVVPEHFAVDLGPPNEFRVFRLADNTQTVCEVFFGQVELGPLGVFPVKLVALGNECLVGLRLAHRFAVLLDHGRQVVIEP